MALVTLQTIFQDAFPAYEQTHPLPAHVRRAARAIMQCRTAALGGHVQACPDGHMARIWYNSCRHRSCPQCAYLQTERWLALQRARLLACDHYHVSSSPCPMSSILWLANVPVMTTLLFQAVRDTLGTLLADPKYLGAQPGILAALHTWSQTLVLHPHVHCLVTGWADADGAVGRRAERLFVAGPGGDGRLSGQDAGSDPAGLGAWGVGPARADAAAAVRQSLEPPGSPDEDEVACAHHGALSPRGGRRDISGALLCGAAPSNARLVAGWRACHLHLSRPS